MNIEKYWVPNLPSASYEWYNRSVEYNFWALIFSCGIKLAPIIVDIINHSLHAVCFKCIISILTTFWNRLY